MKLIVGRIFVECRGSIDEFRELRNQLKVRNPQARRRSRYSEDETPEYIEFIDGDGCFLRGLLPWVEEKLQLVEIPYEIVYEEAESYEFVACPENIFAQPLRDYQVTSVEYAIYYKRGIIRVATGGGKTNIIAAFNKIIEDHYDGRTLTFVNKTRLMYQTAERFNSLGLKDVGIIGASEYRPRRHTVVMVQTAHKLLRKGNDSWYDGVTAVNWDETHHLGADTWRALAVNIGAEWSIGYSGTPYRQGVSNYTDPADIQLLGITGGVIVDVSASYLIQQGLLAKPYIFMIPITHTDHECKKDTCKRPEEYHHVERAFITDNGIRNNIAARLTLQLAQRGLQPLILVSKIEHGHSMLRELAAHGLKGYFLSGGPTRHFYDALADTIISEHDDEPDVSMRRFISGEDQFMIGSTVFDEGIDLPAVTDVINLAAGRSFIKNMQRVGRGLRPKPGDNSARIWDFYDYTHEWLTKHSAERVYDYKTEDEYVVYENGYASAVEFFGEEW